MTRTRYYIGTTTKYGATLAPHVFHEIDTVLVGRYGGYTRYDATGAWRESDGGPVIREASVIYECLGNEPDPVLVATTLRDIALQSSVLYTIEGVEGEFV